MKALEEARTTQTSKNGYVFALFKNAGVAVKSILKVLSLEVEDISQGASGSMVPTHAMYSTSGWCGG